MTWRFRSGSRSISFGESMSGLGLVEYPAVEYSMAADVSANPRGDGSRFGADSIPSQTVALTVEARPDERPLDEVWRELVAVWRADDVRKTPGARAVLESDTGRVAFGRPRPLSADFQNKLFGINRAELVFECGDDLWYGPEELTRVRFVPPSPVQSFAWVGEVDASASVKRVNGEVVARNDFTNPGFVDVSAIPAGGFQSSAWSASGGFSLWVPPETPDVPYPSESVFPSEFLYPGE